jgi:hypothetical protein
MFSVRSRDDVAILGTASGSRVAPVQHLRASLWLACLLPLAVLAQSSSASFQVPRQSIDGGAQRAASATYALVGTLGQPDAGSPAASATYTLNGGFHRAAPSGPLPASLFANGFEAP